MVRWSGPFMVLQLISDALETAYKLDPSLPYPWNEWAEVLSALENDDPDLGFVKRNATGKGMIGYPVEPVYLHNRV